MLGSCGLGDHFLPPADTSRFLKVRSEGVSVPRAAGQVPWQEVLVPPLALFTSSLPLSLLASDMPKEPSQWTPGGADWMVLTCKRLASQGMLSTRVGSPRQHPCPFQALRVALCPSGLILKGPGLLRGHGGCSCWQEGGGLGLTCSKNPVRPSGISCMKLTIRGSIFFLSFFVFAHF